MNELVCIVYKVHPSGMRTVFFDSSSRLLNVSVPVHNDHVTPQVYTPFLFLPFKKWQTIITRPARAQRNIICADLLSGSSHRVTPKYFSKYIVLHTF